MNGVTKAFSGTFFKALHAEEVSENTEQALRPISQEEYERGFGATPPEFSEFVESADDYVDKNSGERRIKKTNMDGDVVYSGSIRFLSKNPVVHGNVKAGGHVIVEMHLEVYGDVIATEDLAILYGVVDAKGEIKARGILAGEGYVVATKGVTTSGDVKAISISSSAGNVVIGKNVIAGGNVIADRRDIIVGGYVDAGGVVRGHNIKVVGYAQAGMSIETTGAGGSIEAGGDITSDSIHSSTTITAGGNIIAEGEISVGDPSKLVHSTDPEFSSLVKAGGIIRDKLLVVAELMTEVKVLDSGKEMNLEKYFPSVVETAKLVDGSTVQAKEVYKQLDFIFYDKQKLYDEFRNLWLESSDSYAGKVLKKYFSKLNGVAIIKHDSDKDESNQSPDVKKWFIAKNINPIIKRQYNLTQQLLAKVFPDQTNFTLFRGTTFDEVREIPGKYYDYGGEQFNESVDFLWVPNPVSSWSLKQAVAEKFGDIVIRGVFGRDEIFVTYLNWSHTGFEAEFVVAPKLRELVVAVMGRDEYVGE